MRWMWQTGYILRVLELFDDYEAVRDVLQAYRVDDAADGRDDQAVYEEHGYLLDPHTAVGWRVAEDHGDPI